MEEKFSTKGLNLGELIERARHSIEDTKRLIARAERRCQSSREAEDPTEDRPSPADLE